MSIVPGSYNPLSARALNRAFPERSRRCLCSLSVERFSFLSPFPKDVLVPAVGKGILYVPRPSSGISECKDAS